MPSVCPHDRSFLWFFHPFVKSRQGQILVPSPRRDHIRDGLAAIHLARHFPLPAYSDMVLEPSRQLFTPGPNLIVIGQVQMLLDRTRPRVREPRPATVDPRLLGARFDRMVERACLRLQDDPDAVVNTMAQTAHVSGPDGRGLEVDYGVIRRSFLGPHENTLIFEGRHWLGTLGAVLVATNPAFMGPIRSACAALEGFDPTLPVEILVRATFDPVQAGDSNDPFRTTAQPLMIVYNGRFACDLEKGGRWIDQMPWDHVVDAWADTAMASVAPADRTVGRSVLEIECDMTGSGARIRDLCRRHILDRFGKGTLPNSWPAEREEVVRHLISQLDRVRMTFFEMAPWGSRKPAITLPAREKSVLAKERKRFLFTLALHWFAGIRFHPDDETIRALFPDFSALKKRHRGGLSADFKSQINGKMREVFGPLLGPTSGPKETLDILLDGYGRGKHYRIDLKQAGIRVKFRF